MSLSPLIFQSWMSAFLLTYLPTTKYKMWEQSQMPWKNCSGLFSPRINSSMTSQSTSRKLCNFHWCFWTIQVPWFSAFRRDCVFLLLKFSQLALSPSALLPVRVPCIQQRGLYPHRHVTHSGPSFVRLQCFHLNLWNSSWAASKETPSLTPGIRSFYIYIFYCYPVLQGTHIHKVFPRGKKCLKKKKEKPPNPQKRPKCAELSNFKQQ